MTELNSQNEIVLDHLRRGKSITQAEAFLHKGIGHLARRIRDLKDRGHEIHKEMIEVTKKDGSRARVARYTLIKEKSS